MIRELVALALLVGVVMAIGALSEAEHRPQYPLVQAATPSCPKTVNPCDRVNCHRPETRKIA